MSAFLFFKEALGVPNVTQQQREGAVELSKLVNAKFKKWKGEELTEEEESYAEKIGLSIMSGKGTGKDAFLAWCVLWFLICFYNSKIPLTGPSKDHMKDVLMAEIAKWANAVDDEGNPRFVFKNDIVILSDKIYVKDPKSPNSEGKSWWAKLKTAPKDSKETKQAKSMDGLHEDFMMIGVDEADGVPQPVLTSLDTTLTSPVNFILMIYNPSKNYGYAYETQYETRSKYWAKLHWDSRYSENVDKQQIEQIKEVYGEESAEYRVNVLGLPPEQSENTLIPKEWIDMAIDRDITPDPKQMRIMGLDPSRQGGDPAGVIIRDHFVIKDMLEFRKLDTQELADAAAEVFIDWECDLMFVDMIGNGAGVYDLLNRRFPGKVRGVDVSKKPKDSRKKFFRLRDELYWKVRKLFEKGLISIPRKHKLTRKLVNEATVMRREEQDSDSTGKIKIEGKMKMKSRGLKSPNLLEALLVTTDAPDGAFKNLDEKLSTKKKDAYDKAFDEMFESKENTSWMSI